MNNQQLKQTSNVESPTTPNAAAPHSRDLRIKNVVVVRSSDSSSLTVKTSGGNVESHPSSGSCSVDANNAAPISGGVNRIAGGESEKSSLSSASYYSDSVDISNEGSTTTPTPTAGNSFRSLNKPHKGNDVRWEAIQQVKTKDGSGCELGLGHFRLLKKLGFGDIGSVYLAELRGSGGSGSGCLFAMKVMDKGMLAGRKKLTRAQTERDILGLLDHPFLPTLYSHFETEKFSCLLMEFCNGGDLHILRQRQPGKHFSEQAARFYASEVLLALEYLHMMGVVYRDLKPENVLVREDGHIMLSDFDLSLRCCVNPTLLKSTTKPSCAGTSSYCIEPSCLQPGTSCVQPPSCLQPSCFIKPRRFFNTKHKNSFKSSNHHGSTESKPEKTTNSYSIRPDSLPVVVVEPTTARSMSFVGTHEYLSPEIIRGDGHGSAVDWWTFGVFLYELLHGKTPFKGNGNRETLLNVVSQPLKFQEVGGGTGTVSFAAKDLIRGLLVKDPQKRLGYKRGAIEIKQHPFFAEVNWALIRGTVPPEIPKKVDLGVFNNVKSGEEVSDQSGCGSKQGGGGGGSDLSDRGSGSPYLDFEFF